MLLVKISLETPPARRRSGRGRCRASRLGHRPVLGRHDAARRAGVAHRPHRREHPRSEEQQRPRPAAGSVARAPAASSRLSTNRPRIRRGGAVVHERAGPGHERLEARDDRIAGESAAGQREVGRRRPVERAQPAHPVGPQRLGPAPGTRYQRVKLAPPVPACLHERVEIQTGTPFRAPTVTFARWPLSTTGSPSRPRRASSSSSCLPGSGHDSRRHSSTSSSSSARSRARDRPGPARQQRIHHRGVPRRRLPHPVARTTSRSRRGTAAGASGSSPPGCACVRAAASRRGSSRPLCATSCASSTSCPRSRGRRDLDPGHEPNQRLGDLAAGTLVVRERRPAVTPAATYLPPPPGGAPFLEWDVSGVSLDDIATLRQFLERRISLSPGRRSSCDRSRGAGPAEGRRRARRMASRELSRSRGRGQDGPGIVRRHRLLRSPVVSTATAPTPTTPTIPDAPAPAPSDDRGSRIDLKPCASPAPACSPWPPSGPGSRRRWVRPARFAR